MNCLTCGSPCTLQRAADVADRQRFGCPHQVCKRRYSIRKGSFFARSKLSLAKILAIVYHMINQTKVHKASRNLSISERVVIDFYNFTREVMSSYILWFPVVLGGVGDIVEIDECMLGAKRKYNRGSSMSE